jgi:PIN domain nuclease of toxin-antitoxin system
MTGDRLYLIDTNVLIWLSSDLKRIPMPVLDVLEDPASGLFISTVSFWELSIKQSLGKIDAEIDFDRIVESHGFRELPVVSRYMGALRKRPLLHGDPFDRMIVSQAIAEGMTLVTSDRRLAEYPISILRV